MNTLFNYLLKRKKVILISLLFFLIQLPFLDQLALLRGERDIVLTGWSLAKTGRDLYGRFMPLEFTGIDPNVPFVPIYFTALWWLLVPVKSVFTARLFFVLISTTIPFLVFEIVNHLRKDERIAYFTSVVFCFSPGIFYITRLALEIGIAFPLLLSGILLYLKQYRIISLPFFFLAFFSYHGFRPLIPVLLIYLEFFYFISGQKKNFLKHTFFAIIFTIFLLFLSIKIDGNLMKSRSSDLIFFNFVQLSNQVDYKRNTSLAPHLISAIFNNKFTELGMFLKDNFFGGISFEYLFRNGDPSALYATTFSGQFFLSYVIFFILAFVYLGKKGTKYDIYILGIIFVGLIPSLSNVSYPSYSIRAILSSVGYSYLFVLGMVYLIDSDLKLKKSLNQAAAILIVLTLAIEILYLGYNFYFRRYITMSQMYFETERILPIHLTQNNSDFKIYTSSSRDMLFGYLFFKDGVDFNQIQEVVKRGSPYTYNNLTFLNCDKNILFQKVIISDLCLSDLEYIKISKSNAQRIPYTNYSNRSSFFIFE